MIEFIVGGLFTLGVLTLGIWMGYIAGTKQIDKVANEIKLKFTPPSTNSGPVKVITKEELDQEKQSGFINKIKRVIS